MLQCVNELRFSMQYQMCPSYTLEDEKYMDTYGSHLYLFLPQTVATKWELHVFYIVCQVWSVLTQVFSTMSLTPGLLVQHRCLSSQMM